MTVSIVLYGRNDNYGYNLHKRAALSLNCMAEVLTDVSDEILFVDYNTPDDFPTFPEAIQDTLTKRARDILRILRVRPHIHQRFRSKTHLVALEPVARNVAVRRSCPDNQWILSTNTDIIFVPQIGDSLTKIAQDLSPGFYHAPRIEIPEVLWESLDRQAPVDVIATVREWGSTLHLNEIVLGSKFILYDGPGDFQLLLRDDLFDNHGFHEEMLLGWHVDSNIAKRMYLKYGKVGDLGSKVYGYHCDHTRQVTPAHSHTRLQNDWRRFCDQVDSPDVPEQADTWGCVNDTIEEVRLVGNPGSIYVQALREAIGNPLTEPQVTKYSIETYNRSDYDPRHMVPFLADMFASMPRTSNVAWYGAGIEMLSRFATVWARLRFAGKILVDPELVRPNDLTETIGLATTSDKLDKADAFVFDFGGLPGLPRDRVHNKQLSGQLLHRFLEVVREERRRLSAGVPPRRVIALNTINNQFETLVCGYIAAAATPCATHMRHGFVLPTRTKDDWLALLNTGQAGIRLGDRVNSDPRKLGIIVYGPYKYLDAGCYRLSLKVELAFYERQYDGSDPCLVVVVQAGGDVFGVYLLNRSALANPDHQFLFVVPRTADEVIGGIETRIMLLNPADLSIQAVTIESMPASSSQVDSSHTTLAPSIALNIDNWLPYLFVGPLGCADRAEVVAQRGDADFVLYGPYWLLPVGYYELVIHFEGDSSAQPFKPMIRADVITGDLQLVAANFHLDAQCAATTTIRLPFEVSEISSEWRQIETRIWSSGEERFRILLLSVKPLEQSSRRDLLPFLLVGDAGRRVTTGISNIEDRIGVVAYSPNIRFQPGAYRITFAVEVGNIDEAHDGNRACAFALVKHGAEVLEVGEITSTASQVREQELVFEVPSSQNNGSGLELFFQVVRSADINLRKLTIERIVTTAQQRSPAVLGLRDWLPFLQRGKSAHAVENGIDVSEGLEEFALYGPYWTLPPGRYEMRALIVPNPRGRDHGAVVSAQVTAEQGARLFVQGKLPFGQYKLIDAAAAVEFRLPFSLSGDLSAAARTIETRIFTPGDASFRVLSLAVIATSDKPESNWFPYLIVGECGVHTGGEIKGVKDKIGYIACTPPMRVVPGRYRLWPDIAIEGNVRGEDAVAFEAWSGSDLIAIETVKSASDQPLEFDVAGELSDKDFELRVRAVAPIVSSIRGLIVEKVSDAIEPGALPAVLRLKNWLPFLELGAAGLRVGQSVVARQDQNGCVVYGPYWPLTTGDYVMLFAVELDKTETASAGTWLRPKNIIKAFLSSAKLLRDGGADVMFDGRQIAVVEGFTIGSLFSRSTSLWLPFKITDDDVKNGSRVETRVWTTGRHGFRIRSLIVRRRMPNDRSYKQQKQSFLRLTRAKIVDRIQVLMK